VSAGRDSTFSAEVDQQGRIVVTGEVDQSTAPALEEAISQAATICTGDLVLDLAGVTFLDSGGMNVFVRCSKPLAEAGRQLVLLHPQPSVQRALEVGGIGTFTTVR
jgi:anti-anti-sigma factor